MLEPSFVLISTKFYMEISNHFIRRIDYRNNSQKLDGINDLIFVPDSVMGNKIIIIAKDSILWKKKLFYNSYTNEKTKLEITIGKPKLNGKVDAIIRSLNKIEHIDSENIVILEIED